jgi:hypothetical protein
MLALAMPVVTEKFIFFIIVGGQIRWRPSVKMTATAPQWMTALLQLSLRDVRRPNVPDPLTSPATPPFMKTLSAPFTYRRGLWVRTAAAATPFIISKTLTAPFTFRRRYLRVRTVADAAAAVL